MKLLFDENLSPGLAVALADLFPSLVHVRDVGLKSSTDRKLWDYAAENGCAIITKDADFRHYGFLFGPPPKVSCIGLGNCSTRQISDLLRSRVRDIEAFLLTEGEALLVLK